MTIQQILQRVHTSPKGEIIFFLEGSFYKLYNHHAMYFCENVKKMKVHTRLYKNVKTYVHSIGFPQTAFGKYVELLKNQFGATNVEIQPKYAKISGIQWQSTIKYEVWREEFIREEEKKEQTKTEEKFKNNLINQDNTNPKTQEIIEKIRAYRIEYATPIDAFNFLQKLKKLTDECATTETI